jgi:hypothetical protein
VETVTPNSRVEIAAVAAAMRRHLWHALVKSIVEAGELLGRGKYRLGGDNQLQRLRDMQWREMRGSAQLS